MLTRVAFTVSLLAATSCCMAQTLAGRVETRSFIGQVLGNTVFYSVYLPPGYDTETCRYPVVYHLHGIGGSHTGQQTTTVPTTYERVFPTGLNSGVIVVFPNGYVDSFWADSADGVQPAETDVMEQLIPHIDGSYRTLSNAESRAISGFSMGGFGALKFYTKYPSMFTACSAYDGALLDWDSVQTRHPVQTQRVFASSEARFNEYSPWWWATQNAAELSERDGVRSIVGSLVDYNRAYRDHLIALGISIEYVETACGHQLGCLANAEGDRTANFIRERLVRPCDADFNASGNVSVQDVFDFLAAWFAASASADTSRNGSFDVQDLFLYLAIWFTGCE